MPLARNHMSSNLLTVEPEVSLVEVARRMVSRDVGAVLVMDDERLAGILTERDVLRAVAAGLDDSTLVRDCMTRDPETLESDETTREASSGR
jgi:CBS domain-containing protein